MSDYPPLRYSVPPDQHPKPPEPSGVTYQDLQRVLTFLPRNRFTFLHRKVTGVSRARADDGERPRDVLLLALYDWFAHLGGYVSDDQQQRIVERFAGPLGNAVLAEGQTRAIAHRVLTLTDGRYAAVSGSDVWYDYELDEDRRELPEPGVTHISCDLAGLQLRIRRRVAELRGGKDAAARRSDGPAGRPADGHR